MRTVRSISTAFAALALILAVAPATSAHGKKCETSAGVTHKQDRVTGTPGDDVIKCAGNTSNHIVDGLGGNDLITTGAGNDVVNGGDGNDTIRTDGGSDRVDGGSGDDQIFGEAGADILDGGAGLDVILGGDGNDTITTGEGDGAGPGQNVASGDAGNDSVTGGSDNDELHGGPGVDSLAGGAGDDAFLPGEGADAVNGGAQSIHDTVFAQGATGPVVASVLGATNDGFGSSDTYTGIEGLYGWQFNDQLTGDAGSNLLSGGDGNDILVGGGGIDALAGGDGNDTLNGQAGNDVLTGGPGNDGMAGEAGTDSFAGGDGMDTVLALTASTRFWSDLAGAREDGYGLTGFYAETYTDVEHLTGGSSDDILVGNDGANSLTGGFGNDQLSGLGGDDILVGNEGDDALDGGVDTDSCFGDAGLDAFTACEFENDPDGGLADLVIQSVVLGAPAGSPQANTPHPWTAVIANAGNAPATVYLVNLSGVYSTDTVVGNGDDAGACGTVLSQIPDTVLQAGATMQVVVGCGAVPTGAYLLATVDSSNEVVESDETNNVWQHGL